MFPALKGLALSLLLIQSQPHNTILKAQMFRPFYPPIHGRNSPGLVCHALVNPARGFATPDPDSTMIQMLGVAVAVAGRAQHGYVPVALASGRIVWVEAQLVEPGNTTSHAEHCYANRHKNGSVTLQFTAR